MSLRSCLSMPRTAGTGYWKASSHDPKVLGSGASAAMIFVQGKDCGGFVLEGREATKFGVSVTLTDNGFCDERHKFKATYIRTGLHRLRACFEYS